MNWDELFHTQLQLDRYIEANHKLEEADLFENKVLALLVEVGELANETRCFKFWSQKSASPEGVILEEYVDGLHFMLSLGLEKDLRYEKQSIERVYDLTEGFHQVYENIIKFKSVPDKQNFQQMFSTFLSLGAGLGFSEQAIQSAYHKKNARNHQRQDEGY